MSQINAIYNAIAGWDVRYSTNVPVKVHKMTKLPTNIGTAEGALRIISPLNADADGGGGHIALGRTMVIEWNITDTLYVRPTAHGGALRRSVPQVMNYVGEYLGLVKVNQGLGLSNVWIEDASWQVGVYAYPVDGGDPWYGVQFIVTVHEAIN